MLSFVLGVLLARYMEILKPTNMFKTNVITLKKVDLFKFYANMILIVNMMYTGKPFL
jgi:hypothetical protein